MSKKPPLVTHATKSDVELARVVEREKTIRLIAIGFFVTVGVVAIVIGVVKSLEKPPWLAALSAILIALFGPSGIILQILLTRQKYVEKTHLRTVALEAQLLPERESSSPGNASEAP